MRRIAAVVLLSAVLLIAVCAALERFSPGSRAAAQSPAAKAPAAKAPTAASPPRRFALLVGCTKYDNLDERYWLRGPANDVKLFRSLLIDKFKFDPQSMVTLAEG